VRVLLWNPLDTWITEKEWISALRGTACAPLSLDITLNRFLLNVSDIVIFNLDDLYDVPWAAYVGDTIQHDRANAARAFGWDRPPHLAAAEMQALTEQGILRYNEQIWLGLHQESFTFAPLTPMATELLPALREHFAYQVQSESYRSAHSRCAEGRPRGTTGCAVRRTADDRFVGDQDGRRLRDAVWALGARRARPLAATAASAILVWPLRHAQP
jgi:hypothetical protein